MRGKMCYLFVEEAIDDEMRMINNASEESREIVKWS